jgi:4'-phosphopantetheinyl transferase
VTACEVWWAGPDAARPELAEVLSPEERARLARLQREADRDRYLVAHALLRAVLGLRVGVAPAAVGLAVGDDGKPRLADPAAACEFSLSHSGSRIVVAATADTPVGVDVERIHPERDVARMFSRVLSAQERPVLDALGGPARQEAFHRYWARKEAAVKATGHGLRLPFDAITVSAPDTQPELLAWPPHHPPPAPIRLHDLDPGAGYVACLAACTTTALSVRERDAKALVGAL